MPIEKVTQGEKELIRSCGALAHQEFHLCEKLNIGKSFEIGRAEPFAYLPPEQKVVGSIPTGRIESLQSQNEIGGF